MSYQEAVSFLRRLDKEIRICHPGTGKEMPCDEVLRDLSWEEWKTVEEIIKKHKLPCSLVSGPYGFSLIIYSFKKDILLLIKNVQFPFLSAKRGFNGQLDTLHRISPLTHNQQNIDLLAALHFEPQNLNPLSYAY
ncbi:MAG: hypothetical protein Athens071424_17 [Parcubacteria group bacterium Athens0714_24]|nr:MAG: hypothetical protein Athens071424_17 [Parcubacteria group bacterium Athens0714_24]